MKAQNHPYLVTAIDALNIEARAIESVAAHLSESFIKAVDTLLEVRSPVVVMGVGKSGHIGRKIAATLSSTGTPAFFVHPTEAGHGDLGVLEGSDAVILLSHSGESEELLALLPHITRFGSKIIAITGAEQSRLARYADVALMVQVKKEACPLNLAPTASTTATLALGDALAVVLLHERGFKAEDFARSHPSGSLGRRLLLLVKDVMRIEEGIPKVRDDSTLAQAVCEMTAKSIAMTTVVNAEGRLVGVFTDGDLRRVMEEALTAEKPFDWGNTTICNVMNPTPLVVAPQQLASAAVAKMQDNRVNQLVVMEAEKIVGVLHIHDLTNAKVV